MKKKKKTGIFLLAFFCITNFHSYPAQSGDTLTIQNKKFKILSGNLIPNPGFEDGFTGWTDATATAATLTSAKFSIANTGGVSNSKYLIGLTNENSGSAGSIGTGWPVASGKTYLFAYQVKYLSATAPAGNEIYLKTSLTNNKTSATEPKVIMNEAYVAGGGVWSQNYVYFSNSNPVYTYLMVRFRWLNNRFGFDDFQLYEASEVANNAALLQAISTAESLYNAQAIGASELLEAINIAKTFSASNVPSEVEKATGDLNTAILNYQYANASPSNPLNLTSRIANPSFDDNSTTGWENAGTVNYHLVEFYQKTFNMFQIISGLPAGKYRLKVQGYERPKANDGGAAYRAKTETVNARIYAQAKDYSDVYQTFNSLYKHTYTGTGSLNGYLNSMAAAETMLSNTSNMYYDMLLDSILVGADGKLTIGVKSDFQQSGYWVLFDNFRLEYLGKAGVDDLIKALNNRIADAQTLLNAHIQTSAAARLNSAIAFVSAALNVNPPVQADLLAAKDSINNAIETANISAKAFSSLKKAIDNAYHILKFLDKADEITKLQNAIQVAEQNYANLDLTLAQINTATTTLTTVTRSVGKKIYVPGWMLGDVYNPANNWSIERSKQSKNWILFWEPGFGDNPGTTIDECLALVEKSFDFYADSLKFIKRGASKTDTYKMIVRLRFSSEWEATGSGVDNTIGLLTLTPWAMTSRGGQTVAHEVGHCFQYQVHCDNNDNNGWMYGFGSNGSGGNSFWEMCAQWQAYKIFPNDQFTNEWFNGYLASAHKHPLHETPRYNNYFIHDYWTYLHGMDIVGRLWNKSYSPEDPVDSYKRITTITQSAFNDQMWDCAARFSTWDIPALKTRGASYILSRPQPKLKSMGSNIWRIDSLACPENYGHNIIRLNAPLTAQTVTAHFDGLAGIDGFRKLNVGAAGWRIGFVALQKDGRREYGEVNQVSMTTNNGKLSVSFAAPANTDKLWFVVSGAPQVHWRHAWDDNDANDEQWPYQVSFVNTNLLGYANVINSAENNQFIEWNVRVQQQNLLINNLPELSNVKIVNTLGRLVEEKTAENQQFNTTLPRGVFIIVVESPAGVQTRKVIID